MFEGDRLLYLFGYLTDFPNLESSKIVDLSDKTV